MMEERSISPDALTVREKEILERLSAGLSDQQIAAELFLSPNTVRWYNRQIYSKLGVGSRTQAIAQAKALGLLENGETKSLPPAARHSLPLQTTPFIGRSHEIAELTRLLRENRLLTLTGAGGIGKTRLALRAVSEVMGDFADGVYFIDLAPLSDHNLVVKAIAGALGIVENTSQSPLNVLKRALEWRELLLLIDNFEHVIVAAPLVSDLLAACPRLKIVVTSREALRLSGEQEYPVSPLSLPPAEMVSVEHVRLSEAGSLFVQRAQMLQPGFALTADNAQPVAEICTRLDGLPLAIELAAARCKLLTPQALLDRLDSRLNVLTTGARDAPARQRTLRDTIEWSYNLLDSDEKTLFMRLAVFRGGCSLDAIEAVGGYELATDALDALASLVDKSLVKHKEAVEDEPRFSMLETIHEYARERLWDSGEAEIIRRRHAEYFVALAEQGQPELRLAGYDYWCQRFEREVDNFRAALEWSLNSGDVALGVRLASALGLFWYGQGYHIEGIHWADQLLERLDEVPVSYHPQFLNYAGHMAFLRDLDAGKRLFERQLKIARELGDNIQVAWAFIFLGYVAQREPEAALALAEEGLALFRELHHQPGIAQALNIIGEISRINGLEDRAKSAYEECLAVCQQTGEARRICYMYFGLSHIAQHEHNPERAMEFGQRGMRLARERKDVNEMAHGMAVLAGAFILLGQAQMAARLLGASEAVAERMGAFHHPSDMPEVDRIIRTVRANLGEAAFEAAWAEGRATPMELAVADALGERV